MVVQCSVTRPHAPGTMARCPCVGVAPSGATGNEVATSSPRKYWNSYACRPLRSSKLSAPAPPAQSAEIEIGCHLMSVGRKAKMKGVYQP